jgi:hypothetical protein
LMKQFLISFQAWIKKFEIIWRNIVHFFKILELIKSNDNKKVISFEYF